MHVFTTSLMTCQAIPEHSYPYSKEDCAFLKTAACGSPRPINWAVAIHCFGVKGMSPCACLYCIADEMPGNASGGLCSKLQQSSDQPLTWIKTLTLANGKAASLSVKTT